jgi:hypothetical protein
MSKILYINFCVSNISYTLWKIFVSCFVTLRVANNYIMTRMINHDLIYEVMFGN